MNGEGNPNGAGGGVNGGQPVGAPVQSNGAQPVAGQPATTQNPAQTVPAGVAGERPQKKSKKLWLIAVAVILVLIGAGVGITFLIIGNGDTSGENDNAGGETEKIGEATEEEVEDALARVDTFSDWFADAGVSDEEIAQAADAELEKIESEAEKFEFILRLANGLYDAGRLEKSVSYLEAIDEGTLNEQQRFLLYANLYAIYTELGNDERASEYIVTVDSGHGVQNE